MYRIIKMDGTEVGITETVNYIKTASNGCFVPATSKDAKAVVFDGNVYNLALLGDINGEKVVVKEFDGAKVIEEYEDIAELSFIALANSGTFDDETITEHADIFNNWAYPITYTVGDIVNYDGVLYRCVQSHTSQSDWTPDVTASLWTKIGDPSEEYPEWSQPLGAHDAYAQGDKVSHNGKNWVSDIDANVWEPGVYGWTEVTE